MKGLNPNPYSGLSFIFEGILYEVGPGYFTDLGRLFLSVLFMDQTEFVAFLVV